MDIKAKYMEKADELAQMAWDLDFYDLPTDKQYGIYALAVEEVNDDLAGWEPMDEVND